MKKFIATFLCSILVFLAIPINSRAENIYTIKVPVDATISMKGAWLTESSLIKEEAVSGKIHSVAQKATGITYGYKYYVVSNLQGMDDIVVYNRNMVPLMPTVIDVDTRIIEYSNADQDFIAKCSERINGAAIAYHNRTGGYGNTTFYNYFQYGSDAATKCELSDSGRYWGQFVSARVIEKIEILEVYPYGDNAFTTKVRIVADGSGFVEDYTINFLFQNTGKGFYVTYFTFMK